MRMVAATLLALGATLMGGALLTYAVFTGPGPIP